MLHARPVVAPWLLWKRGAQNEVDFELIDLEFGALKKDYNIFYASFIFTTEKMWELYLVLLIC